MMDSFGRLARSFQQRGLKRTLENFRAIYDDYWFDVKNGTDTRTYVELNDLDIPSPNKHLAVQYEGTRVRALDQMLQNCPFPPDSVFVDYGSGKGRTLLVASKYPFKRVVGIDFSADLCTIARRNAEIYRKKYPTAAAMEIIDCDAVEYKIRDDENVFFFFNPFKPQVLIQVLNNIVRSIEKTPRAVSIIYNNPLYPETIEDFGAFSCSQTFTYGSSDFLIYRAAS